MPDPEVIEIINPVAQVELLDPPDEEHKLDIIEVTPEDWERLMPDTEPKDIIVFDLNTQQHVHIVRKECGQEPGCWHVMVAEFGVDPIGPSAPKKLTLKKRSS